MSKKTILIVDDEPININIVADILYEKYKIRVATDGEMALKMIEKKRPDLILLDVVMPKMDGYEVATQLTSDPDTNDIPFIFLTAKSDPRSIMEGFNYGAVDYIRKPFSKEELIARVATHLKIDELQKSLSSTTVAMLKQYESQIAHYLELIDENIISLVSDLDGVIIDVSQAFCDETGYSKEELIDGNSSLVEYLHIPHETQQELWSTIKQNDTWSGETKAKTKSGVEYQVWTTIAPSFDESSGEKIGYRVIQKNLRENIV